jgi:hypothetical protein
LGCPRTRVDPQALAPSAAGAQLSACSAKEYTSEYGGSRFCSKS